jgi:hypothetical protein
MTINKKSFLAAIKKGVDKHTPIGVAKSTVGLAKDLGGMIKSKRKLRGLQRDLSISNAQKTHLKKYKRKMIPSRLKDELNTGFPSAEVKEYQKNKEEEYNKLRGKKK